MSSQSPKTKSASDAPKKGASPSTTPKGKSKRKPKAAKLEWNPDKGLTLNEEMFCRAYVLNEHTRRNGTLSYDLAYQKGLDEAPKDDAVYENDGYDDEEDFDDEEGGRRRPRGRGKLVTPSTYDRVYSLCATEASKLLKKPHISKRITKLLNELLTEEFVDGELAKVVAQDDELSPKVRGIEEFNKLRKRTTTTTVEHKFKDLEDMSDEELAAEKARLQGFFTKGRGEKVTSKKKSS